MVRREKVFTAQIRLPVAPEMVESIKDVLYENEDRTDFIREAIEREIARRKRGAKQQSA